MSEQQIPEQQMPELLLSPKTRQELGFEFRSNQLSLANMPVDLVLVRHGESEGNIVKDRSALNGDLSIWEGEFGLRHTSKYRLTDRGRLQAEQAGDWLRKEFPTPNSGFDVHFCSEYVRAIETAAHLKIPNAIWTLDRYLRERDNGIFSGKPATSTTAKEDASEEKKRRSRDLYFYAPPGGESIAASCMRVDLFLDHLSQMCSGLRVLAIVHRNIMMAFRIVLESIPQLKFDQVFIHDPEGELDNCHILHYSRRNPLTHEVHAHLQWVRSVLPHRGIDKGWRQIFRPRYDNQALLAMVSKIPQLVNNTKEEIDEFINGNKTVESPAPERETDEPVDESNAYSSNNTTSSPNIASTIQLPPITAMLATPTPSSHKK